MANSHVPTTVTRLNSTQLSATPADSWIELSRVGVKSNVVTDLNLQCFIVVRWATKNLSICDINFFWIVTQQKRFSAY